MRKQFYLAGLLLFVTATFIINSCSKSKSSAVTPTRSNLAGTYKLGSETAKQGSGATINILDSIDACEKDDLLKFNTDSSYNYIDAGTVCSPAGDYSGTWDLASSNSLVLDGFSTYTIKSFDNKTLVLVFVDPTSSPSTTYTLTLSKQ